MSERYNPDSQLRFTRFYKEKVRLLYQKIVEEKPDYHTIYQLMTELPDCNEFPAKVGAECRGFLDAYFGREGRLFHEDTEDVWEFDGKEYRDHHEAYQLAGDPFKVKPRGRFWKGTNNFFSF